MPSSSRAPHFLKRWIGSSWPLSGLSPTFFLEAAVDLVEVWPGFRIHPTPPHPHPNPLSTSSFHHERTVRLAVDPGGKSRGLGLETGLRPRPLVRRMALGGSTGPRARGPGFVRLASEHARRWGVSACWPSFPWEKLGCKTDADPGPPEVKVGLSEDTQLKSVWQSIDMTLLLLTTLEYDVDVG